MSSFLSYMGNIHLQQQYNCLSESKFSHEQVVDSILFCKLFNRTRAEMLLLHVRMNSNVFE